MTRRSARLVPVLIVTVMGASAATRPVLAAAAKAIGTDSLRCVTIAGTAYAGAVGQQRESARNVDWPRIDGLANYTRTMDWEHARMTEEFDRQPGLNPAAWKYGVRRIDGPVQRQPHQVFTVKDRVAWHLDGANGAPVASTPDFAEIACLPRERLLFEADLLDTDRPLPAAPTPDQGSFFTAVRKLGLNPSQVVPVHGRPAPWPDVK